MSVLLGLERTLHFYHSRSVLKMSNELYKSHPCGCQKKLLRYVVEFQDYLLRSISRNVVLTIFLVLLL